MKLKILTLAMALAMPVAAEEFSLTDMILHALVRKLRVLNKQQYLAML